jgi:hypothetical protein
MTSIILKFIYLTIAAGLGIAGLKYDNIENKKLLTRSIFFIVSYCFAFWGVSSLFRGSDGYPPFWFFYISTVPVWVAVLIVVINIKK